MKNYYPEKPVVQYFNAQVEMSAIIEGIRNVDCKPEVKRSAYVIIRNETGNGRSVVNGTNIAGVQSDSGKWDAKWDNVIVATAVKNENRTGKLRGFVVFKTLTDGIAFLCDKIKDRGLYIGGQTHLITNTIITTSIELATAYEREWVTGKSNYDPTEEEIKSFTSMYGKAEILFK